MTIARWGQLGLALTLLAAVVGCAPVPAVESVPLDQPAAPTPTAAATSITPTSAATSITPTSSSTPPTVSSVPGESQPTDSGAPEAAADDAGNPTGGEASPSPGVLVPEVPGDRLPGEPDPRLTPGALNPAVTQATIRSTICTSGWTATIRPASTFTNQLKKVQIGLYGYTNTSPAAYEEDHLISLQLGGAPRDPRNLWPEPWSVSLADGRPAGARIKDTLETTLKRQVCAGKITLAQAQSWIGDHWVHYFYGLPLLGPAPSPSASQGSVSPGPT